MIKITVFVGRTVTLSTVRLKNREGEGGTEGAFYPLPVSFFGAG